MINWSVSHFKSSLSDIAANYIEGLPIMVGAAIGAYALCSMFSKSLAKLAAVFAFGYGFLIVLV